MKKRILTSLCVAAAALTPGLASAQDAAVQGNSDLVKGVVGQDVLQTGNLDAAIVKLEAECRKTDNDPALLINLGQAYARSGDFESAEASFIKARDSRKRYDILLANGEVMSTRAAAKEALSWLNDLQSGPDIARY